MKRRRAFQRLAALMAVVAGFQGVAVAGPEAPGDLLPDLSVARLYGFELESRPNGRIWLRFGTIGWNVGDGPLEARGARNDPDDAVMTVKQRIYNSGGGHRDRAVPAVMIYETGDRHDHWHLRQFMVAKLYKRGAPDGDVYGLRKLGYCLLDAARMANPPPGSPSTRGYPNGSCGTRSSTSVRTGLSIGYGDDYPPHYAHQSMDITGLKRGAYRFCTTVDVHDDFVEGDEANNQRWTDVRINLRTRKLSVVGTGVGACGPSEDG